MGGIWGTFCVQLYNPGIIVFKVFARFRGFRISLLLCFWENFLFLICKNSICWIWEGPLPRASYPPSFFQNVWDFGNEGNRGRGVNWGLVVLK